MSDPTPHALARITNCRTTPDRDAAGRTSTLTYDAFDRVPQHVDALSRTTALAYDANGNLPSLTDAKNHAVVFTYDNLDQLATRNDPLSQQDAYSFDLNGWLHQHTDRNGQVTTYTHEGLGRLTDIARRQLDDGVHVRRGQPRDAGRGFGVRHDHAQLYGVESTQLRDDAPGHRLVHL